MVKEEKIRSLEELITKRISVAQALPDEERELEYSAIRNLAKQYFELTGRHYNIDNIREKYK